MSKSTIIAKLQERLNRNLKQNEVQAFSLDRSKGAYQLILDYVSDKEKSVVELEQYCAFMVTESKPYLKYK
jgi:hypothetical protein